LLFGLRFQRLCLPIHIAFSNRKSLKALYKKNRSMRDIVAQNNDEDRIFEKLHSDFAGYFLNYVGPTIDNHICRVKGKSAA